MYYLNLHPFHILYSHRKIIESYSQLKCSITVIYYWKIIALVRRKTTIINKIFLFFIFSIYFLISGSFFVLFMIEKVNKVDC